MTLAQRIVVNEQNMANVGKFKPQFSWCIRCAGFDGCYPEGRGPNFLDADCYRGPMAESERERAREELNDN